MESFIELMKEINIAQIFVIFAGGWFFYNRLSDKIDDLRNDLTGKIDGTRNDLTGKIDGTRNELTAKIESTRNELKSDLTAKINDVQTQLTAEIHRVETQLTARIDKLTEKTEDVDRRLCRIEGSLHTHGHCLFQQAKPEQKAQ